MDDITKRRREYAGSRGVDWADRTIGGEIKWTMNGDGWHGHWWTPPPIHLAISTEGIFWEPTGPDDSYVYHTPPQPDFAQLYEAIIQQQIEKGE
jgi:hypothetical protein